MKARLIWHGHGIRAVTAVTQCVFSRRRGRMAWLALAVSALLLGGCAGIERQSGDEVAVDTAPIGDIMRGVRHWMAWPTARGYCRGLDKVARIKRMAGPIVTYRCIRLQSDDGGVDEK